MNKREPSPIAQGQLPVVAAPADLWAHIEASAQPSPRRGVWPWAFATAAAATILVFAIWPGETWVKEGRIELGEIGVVDVKPNSRARIAVQKPGEIRMVLAYGEIEASVTAPPRLFMVETPSAVAVDLGCAYRMRTDKEGNGLLEVTSGWVSLERDGRESLVPAGANCKMRGGGRGPGTPYFSDAPERFVAALDAFDLKTGGLDTILDLARARDTLTLWHLLARVEGADRERVFDRMATLVRLPDLVTREKALSLDEDTLVQWREDLAWVW